jgi:LuxR family transcriptional regulator, quorum-sensing system regulator CciR
MTQLADVQIFVDESQKIRKLDQLSALLGDITSNLGFDFFALVQHVDVRKSSNKETVWIGNYPSAWIEVFERDGLYATDPIHIASQRTHAGFTWSDVDKLVHLSAHHRRVLAAASKEGLGDGYTIPTHLPGESNGTCSFAMKCGRALPEASLMAAQLIGTYAMEAGRRIVRSDQGEHTSRPKLTPRQLECVIFAARGKTDWEIATILGIKETTAREYIEDACARYDVHKRMQLVVRALHDGHLTLRDAIG